MQIGFIENKSQVFTKVIYLSITAIILSAIIIGYFNVITESRIEQVYNRTELAALTFMPYMISAVVAAITAICITNLLPWLKVGKSLNIIETRLKEMAAGDISTKLKPNSNIAHIQTIMFEMNNTVDALGNQLVRWKAVNRQQWELLQSIRSAASGNNCNEVIDIVNEMEKKWEKIAEFEDKLTT